jgi:hypothetical protein
MIIMERLMGHTIAASPSRSKHMGSGPARQQAPGAAFAESTFMADID